jgi:hypothetical protein
LEKEINEIKEYSDGRYVSAPEAVWCIFHFDTHSQVPNVVRLQVHLPGQHMVTFDPSESIDSIRARAEQEKTTLTAFFEANNATGVLGEEARKYTYQEFPQHFTFKRQDKVWKLRERGFALGRM